MISSTAHPVKSFIKKYRIVFTDLILDNVTATLLSDQKFQLTVFTIDGQVKLGVYGVVGVCGGPSAALRRRRSSARDGFNGLRLFGGEFGCGVSHGGYPVGCGVGLGGVLQHRLQGFKLFAYGVVLDLELNQAGRKIHLGHLGVIDPRVSRLGVGHGRGFIAPR